ncbi:hypothetical protein AC579_458 [Pseudocercospora musae]|uniref:Uncharacterized protein n=1 Tax=Pseudocercospora musae TaxID=113226 RepID=A0A139IN84_9PEZI|nr:hypothetical protein AC579_458 [Pseudocercospora musae]
MASLHLPLREHSDRLLRVVIDGGAVSINNSGTSEDSPNHNCTPVIGLSKAQEADGAYKGTIKPVSRPASKSRHARLPSATYDQHNGHLKARDRKRAHDRIRNITGDPH